MKIVVNYCGIINWNLLNYLTSTKKCCETCYCHTNYLKFLAVVHVHIFFVVMKSLRTPMPTKPAKLISKRRISTKKTMTKRQCWLVQLNLNETDLLFRYLCHHLTFQYFWRFAQICKKFAAFAHKIVIMSVVKLFRNNNKNNFAGKLCKSV